MPAQNELGSENLYHSPFVLVFKFEPAYSLKVLSTKEHAQLFPPVLRFYSTVHSVLQPNNLHCQIRYVFALVDWRRKRVRPDWSRGNVYLTSLIRNPSSAVRAQSKRCWHIESSRHKFDLFMYGNMPNMPPCLPCATRKSAMNINGGIVAWRDGTRPSPKRTECSVSPQLAEAEAEAEAAGKVQVG